MTPPQFPPGCTFDQMTFDEIPMLAGWAADEGWNPGVGDLDVAWALDPDAFIALRRPSCGSCATPVSKAGNRRSPLRRCRTAVSGRPLPVHDVGEGSTCMDT